MITLITPTGDRPEMFDLCERWMARQTWRAQGRPWQWLVVHNGRYRLSPTLGQVLVQLPKDRRKSPYSLLGESLLAALPLVRYDKIIVIEDDDWYAPDYVEWMATQLDKHEAAGETRTLYYDLQSAGYVTMGNREHASLCSTGFRRDLMRTMRHACQAESYSVDHRFWRQIRDKSGLTDPGDRPRVIGMKGVPGTPNYTLSATRNRYDLTPDPHGRYLESLVDGDVKWYRSLQAPRILERLTAWSEFDVDTDEESLVIGKGPTFDRAAAWIEQHHDALTIGLNHVVERQPVEIAHVIDLDVFDQVNPRVWWDNCQRVLMPWQPHIGFRPTVVTLETCEHPVVRDLIADGRVLWYQLSTALTRGYTVRPPGPAVECRSFSGEAAVRLLVHAGFKRIHTAGLDGGRAYSSAFNNLRPLTNGAESFDAQTRILDTIPVERIAL